jgi:hypothetical protein
VILYVPGFTPFIADELATPPIYAYIATNLSYKPLLTSDVNNVLVAAEIVVSIVPPASTTAVK